MNALVVMNATGLSVLKSLGMTGGHALCQLDTQSTFELGYVINNIV